MEFVIVIFLVVVPVYGAWHVTKQEDEWFAEHGVERPKYRDPEPPRRNKQAPK